MERVGPFVRAVDAQRIPRVVLHAPPLLTSTVAQMQLRRLRRDGVPVHRVRPERFRALSHRDRASGLAGVFAQRWLPAHQVTDGVWLAVESVRSMGNLGTLLRSAEALGAAGLICLSERVDPYDPAVSDASMGAVGLLPTVRLGAASLSTWSAERGFTVVGTDSQGAWSMDEYPWPARLVVVVGDERRGLSRRVREACDVVVRIDMRGRTGSLNVAVAGSLVLHQAVSGLSSRR